mgnify:CR=1 FL=1
MLIRSQNSEILINFNTLAGIEITEGPIKTIITSYITGCSYLLGEYSTREKALKVLDMIQEAYCEFMAIRNDDMWCGKESAFQMPEDSEVEV